MIAAPEVTVVVLAFGAEPWLQECVEAIHASQGVALRLVVVDNGCSNPYLHLVETLPNTVVLHPATNLGFAGGVNMGSANADTEFFAMVNSDAIVAPDALSALTKALVNPMVGLVSACVLLADQPDLVNTVGNPIHVLGFSWAGAIGTPRTQHTASGSVASATGACAMLRTSWWRALGGFTPEYFAYYEDVDLSWRTWCRGKQVLYVANAIVAHHYEFGRSASKLYLLERNRLLFILTCYERRTLCLLLPPLLAAELSLFCLAVSQGWVGQKCLGWLWIARRARWVLSKRAVIQASRQCSDRQLVDLWSTDFGSKHAAMPAGAGLAQSLLGVYWRVAQHALK